MYYDEMQKAICEAMGRSNDAPDTPDYPYDLNAMHEVEKTMTPLGRFMYVQLLHDLYHDGKDGYAHLATAAQRAEAYLRTTGKWKDTVPPAPPSKEAMEMAARLMLAANELDRP